MPHTAITISACSDVLVTSTDRKNGRYDDTKPKVAAWKISPALPDKREFVYMLKDITAELVLGEDGFRINLPQKALYDNLLNKRATFRVDYYIKNGVGCVTKIVVAVFGSI